MFRALLVDDEPDERELLRTNLERGGLQVVAVASAEDALASEPGLILDLAVIDLRLPGISGWDLVTELRTRRPGLPVIAMSVLSVQDHPFAEGHIVKPFRREDLWRTVAAVLPGWTAP